MGTTRDIKGIVPLGSITGAQTIDGSQGNVFTGTLIGNVTLALTNFKPGSAYYLLLTQDGTGNRTVAFGGGATVTGTPTIDSAASATTLISILGTSDSTTSVAVQSNFPGGGGGGMGGTIGANLTDADATIQVTGGNIRRLPAGTLTNNRTLTLGTTGASIGDQFTVTKLDQTAFTYAVVNGGFLGGTMITLPAGELVGATFQWNGTDWLLIDSAVYPNATSTIAGLFSATDKTKFDAVVVTANKVVIGETTLERAAAGQFDISTAAGLARPTTITADTNSAGVGGELRFKGGPGSVGNADGNIVVQADNTPDPTGTFDVECGSDFTSTGGLRLIRGGVSKATFRLYNNGASTFIQSFDHIIEHGLAGSTTIQTNGTGTPSLGVNAANASINLSSDFVEASGQYSSAPNNSASTTGAVAFNCNLSNYHQIGDAAALTGAVTLSFTNTRPGAIYTASVTTNGRVDYTFPAAQAGTTTFTAAALAAIIAAAPVRVIVHYIQQTTGLFILSFDSYAA